MIALLFPAMKLASFNPKKCREGQWFSRVWLHGRENPDSERVRLVSVRVMDTGRHYQFRREDGSLIQVCFRILRDDFLRWTQDNGQPCTGEELVPNEAPVTKKKRHWYDDD